MERFVVRKDGKSGTMIEWFQRRGTELLRNQQNHFKVILLTGEKYNRKCNEKKNVAFMLLFFSVLSPATW